MVLATENSVGRAIRPLLTTLSSRIEANQVQRILAGIDANGDGGSVRFAGHGVVLLAGLPHQHARWQGGSTAGPSHSRTSVDDSTRNHIRGR